MLRKLLESSFWLLGSALQILFLALSFLSSAYFLYLNGVEFIPFRYTGF